MKWLMREKGQTEHPKSRKNKEETTKSTDKIASSSDVDENFLYNLS